MKTPQQLYEDWEARPLGVEDGELGAYGLDALTRRLKVIGVTLG
jgi:hypothetical protein